MTALLLPWPPSELWPNCARRLHWAVRSKVAAAYRYDCGWHAKAHEGWQFPDGEIGLVLTFHPRTRRRFDLDGALSALKPGIDGMADAWGVDDARFAYRLCRGEPTKAAHVAVMWCPVEAWMAPFQGGE